MTIDRDRMNRYGQAALGAVALALTVLCAVSAFGGGAERRIDGLLKRYAATGPAGKGPAGKDALLERLAGRPMFWPPSKPGSPSFQVVGVLGDMVFFAGAPEGLKVGQSHNGGTVRQIGPDWVEVEVEVAGALTRVPVFTGAAASGPSTGPGGPGGPGAMVGEPGRSGAVRVMSGKGLPPPSVMAEQLKKMPPEMRAKALESLPGPMRADVEKLLN